MIVLGYKITHKMIPDPLVDTFNNNGGKKQHDYETRSKNTPNIQKHHSVQKLYMPQSISIYESSMHQKTKAKLNLIYKGCKGPHYQLILKITGTPD